MKQVKSKIKTSQEDQGGETSEEEERNEASQAFDYPENMSKDEAWLLGFSTFGPPDLLPLR